MFSKRSAFLGLVAATATGVLLADPATAQRAAPTSAQVQAAAKALSSGTSFGVAERPGGQMIVQRRHHRRWHRRRHFRHWRWRHHRRHHWRWGHRRRHHSHGSHGSLNANVNRIAIHNENVNIND
jgi:hypothetical protein